MKKTTYFYCIRDDRAATDNAYYDGVKQLSKPIKSNKGLDHLRELIEKDYGSTPECKFEFTFMSLNKI